jgi:hypothetical protein
VRPVAMHAPVGHGVADDDEVAVDEGRHRAAAVCGEGGKLLAERSRPQELALGAQRDRLHAAAERVDVARLGVGRGRRPADAVRWRIALEDVELVFPDDLAAVGVERHHPFLQGIAAPRGILHVDAVPHDDRRRTAAVGHAPQEVLAVQLKRARQSRLWRGAVACGSSHLGPVTRRRPPGIRALTRQRDGHAK